MSVSAPSSIYRHGKNRDFTKEEYFALSDEMFEAIQKRDNEAIRRIGCMLPANPFVAKVFKEVYGKEHLLKLGVDLTEANLCYGEGWLDEPNER